MTATMNKTHLEQKMAGISQFMATAIDALDQAHAEMRELGWQKETFRSSGGRNVTLEHLQADVSVIADQLIGAKPCEFDTCTDRGDVTCDHCGNRFCPDHGTKRWERFVNGVRTVSDPASCWACGGYNANS